ncbi:MAG: hypothetical protein IT430_15335 [Phycisphaerales bacterium]|nr:hypothetical protein [Phycisphaerales bacterium]
MDLKSLLEQVRARARDADVFDSVQLNGARLECRARGCESEAYFRVEPDESDPAQVWVSFVTPDRWLSESIEADLEHTGDELEELIEEELAELGIEAEITYQHYRSEDRLFTFRTPVEIGGLGDLRAAVQFAAMHLLAYEAAFRELGDVAGSKEEM